MKQSKSPTEAKTVLYVGTTEQLAKEAPHKGLQPPVVLSDVYPGYFASITSKGKWGIIEVNLEALLPDNLAPFHGYIEKLTRKDQSDPWERRNKCLKQILNYRQQWLESLKACGVCMYMLHVPPLAILKVTTYSPFGADSNHFVDKCVSGVDPWEISTSQHQASYALHKGLTRWLTCETVSGDELLNGNSSVRKAIKLDDLLQNRTSLELFYRRTEKDFHSWWKL